MNVVILVCTVYKTKVVWIPIFLRQSLIHKKNIHLMKKNKISFNFYFMLPILVLT